jgi:hypothetical protein
MTAIRERACPWPRLAKTGPVYALNKTGTKRLKENQNDESQYIQ